MSVVPFGENDCGMLKATGSNLLHDMLILVGVSTATRPQFFDALGKVRTSSIFAFGVRERFLLTGFDRRGAL